VALSRKPPAGRVNKRPMDGHKRGLALLSYSWMHLKAAKDRRA
jgi:hypothetical protein